MCMLLDPCPFNFRIPPITLGTPIISPRPVYQQPCLQLNVFLVCNVFLLPCGCFCCHILVSSSLQLVKLHRTTSCVPPASFELFLIPKEAALVLLAEVAFTGAQPLSLLLLGKARATCISVSATPNERSPQTHGFHFFHDRSSYEHQPRISRHDAFL